MGHLSGLAHLLYKIITLRCEFDPRRVGTILSWSFDFEMFSTFIPSLPLAQEGQLSVSGEIVYTILVNRLED